MIIAEILAAARAGALLTKEQAVGLMRAANGSAEFFAVAALADEMSRREFKNRGFVFAQIGLNAEPCSCNCAFCSMAADWYAMESQWRKTADEAVAEATILLAEGIDDLFLMTTADFPMSEYLDIARRIKAILPAGVRLVANIGDFGAAEADLLKEAGFTGVYHIRRVGEGRDTPFDPVARLRTLDIAARSGLELYYCVEPVGPEHTYEEIADEMLRARSYGVGSMAVMRRIPVPGTPLYAKGQISAVELMKLAAVARIVTRPTRSMNAHEPIQMSLIGGVNQLYAEVGANPRDNVSNTEKNRGANVAGIRRQLADAEYEV
jgi:biotin synthase